MAGQFFGVVDHEALLEVARAKLHSHVQEEDEVGEAVAAQPDGRRYLLELGHALSDDQRPEIVEDAAREHHEPVVVEVLVRIDHGFGWPLGPSRPSASSAGVLVVGLVALALGSVDRLLAFGYLSRGEPLEEGVLALEGRLLLYR